MILIEAARKVFNKGTPDARAALDGIDLKVAPGDFVVVIGSNGAGKSTLLGAIAGAVMLDEGKVTIDGKDVTREPTEKRARLIARVFQDPMAGTAAPMTVEENLLLADLRNRKPGFGRALTAGRRERWRDALARFGLGLENRLSDKVELLSGGQRQSLALAMAVLNPPRVLLLDEHTAALDPRTAAIVLEHTVRAIAEHNLTALMVTHNMRQALEVGSHLVMMEAGRVKLTLGPDAKARSSVEDLIARFETADDKILLGARA